MYVVIRLWRITNQEDRGKGNELQDEVERQMCYVLSQFLRFYYLFFSSTSIIASDTRSRRVVVVESGELCQQRRAMSDLYNVPTVVQHSRFFHASIERREAGGGAKNETAFFASKETFVPSSIVRIPSIGRRDQGEMFAQIIYLSSF